MLGWGDVGGNIVDVGRSGHLSPEACNSGLQGSSVGASACSILKKALGSGYNYSHTNTDSQQQNGRKKCLLSLWEGKKFVW